MTFFIHSSIGGHVGFCVLTIVTNSAVNTRMLISFSSDTYPEVGLLNHMAVLFLTF